MKYLVLSEIAKKQEYIFKSNKLKENIGASLIIKYVTEELPKENLGKTKGKSIFEGGGKSLYIFESEENAREFIKEISKRVLIEFSGLELFMVYEGIDFSSEDIIKKIDILYKKLGIKKGKREHISRQISFGVEKVCRSTGLCASEYSSEDNEPISKEIKAKLEAANERKTNFDNLLNGKKYSKIFDNFKDQEKSYVAVVHIDGNKMGSKFDLLKKAFNNISDIEKHNNDYLAALGEMSRDIHFLYEEAFEKMVSTISSNDEVELRPLIFAGDDISFVCSPKKAIKASKVFLDSLNQHKLKIGQNEYELNACAGIAFIKSHYPFSRAYDLAEQLCSNCKKEILNNYEGEDISLIDWHIVQGEISGNIDFIRQIGYENGSNKLNMRPLIVDEKDKNWRSYSNFKKIFEAVTHKNVSRNKIKGLRSNYKDTEAKVKLYFEINQLKDQLVNSKNKSLNFVNNINIDNNVFYDGRAIYFDAIEIMDLISIEDL